jgi:hypothetical protein
VLGKVEHVIRLFDVTVAVQHFTNAVIFLQHRWLSATATTLPLAVKCFFSFLSFCIPSYLKLNTTNNHSSFTINFEQTFMKATNKTLSLLFF